MPRQGPAPGAASCPTTAYLQYTSGSTRLPAGVMISHRNLVANFEQIMSDFFVEFGSVAPPDTTIVSWLPLYHDMGLMLGVCAPILAGVRTVLTSPVSFLQRPARWVQLLAKNSRAFSAAPNFAFELAARKTSDEDMAGLDLGEVLVILSGSERVHPPTLQRFNKRFARFNLPDTAIRPSYGLAEATVYAATRNPAQPPHVVHFEFEECPLATPSAAKGTVQRWSATGCRVHRWSASSIPTLAPSTGGERPVKYGCTAEMSLWATGKSLKRLQRTFGERLVAPSAGTPEGPWLRTGDRGFLSEGELFIIGRIKDLLIVYGRNHSPDDIEATIQEITRGRCAAIAVSDESHGAARRHH